MKSILFGICLGLILFVLTISLSITMSDSYNKLWLFADNPKPNQTFVCQYPSGRLGKSYLSRIDAISNDMKEVMITSTSIDHHGGDLIQAYEFLNGVRSSTLGLQYIREKLIKLSTDLDKDYLDREMAITLTRYLKAWSDDLYDQKVYLVKEHNRHCKIFKEKDMVDYWITQ